MKFIIILIAKTIENILTTLRIIVLSNHKKLIGSLLNLFISLIWIFSTISVFKCFPNHPICILVYASGCFIGSYLGCIIEEKLNLGDNMLTVLTNNPNVYIKLKELDYYVIKVDGYEYNDNILFIKVNKRKKYKLYSIIKLIDKSATIVCESIFNKSNL